MKRILPDFLIVGAQKCGTTSLAAYLRAHPLVFMTTPKEPNFFSYHWERGVDWYAALFAGGAGSRVRGEASVSYAMAPAIPDVPGRIARVVPRARILYVIRHPLERIRSHYRYHVYRGKESARTLAEAMERSPRYLDNTRYGYQLDRYLEFFDRDRIHVISTERLREDRSRTVGETLRFLGVDGDAMSRNLDRQLNSGAGLGRVPAWAELPRAAWRRLSPLTAAVPRPLRRRLHERLTRPLDPAALEIPPSLEARIWDELMPDLVRLRTIVGPGFDLWGRA